jgi:hypothetical protein
MIGFTKEDENQFFTGCLHTVDLVPLCFICNFPRILLFAFCTVQSIVQAFCSINKCSKAVKEILDMENLISVWAINLPIQLKIFSKTKIPTSLNIDPPPPKLPLVNPRALQAWKSLIDCISLMKPTSFIKELYLNQLFCKKNGNWNDKTVQDIEFKKVILFLLKDHGACSEEEYVNFTKEKEDHERKKSLSQKQKERELHTESSSIEDFEGTEEIEVDSPPSPFEDLCSSSSSSSSSVDSQHYPPPCSPPFTIIESQPKFRRKPLPKKFRFSTDELNKFVENLQLQKNIVKILIDNLLGFFNGVLPIEESEFETYVQNDDWVNRAFKKIFDFKIQVVHQCPTEKKSGTSLCTCKCEFTQVERNKFLGFFPFSLMPDPSSLWISQGQELKQLINENFFHAFSHLNWSHFARMLTSILNISNVLTLPLIETLGASSLVRFKLFNSDLSHQDITDLTQQNNIATIVLFAMSSLNSFLNNELFQVTYYLIRLREIINPKYLDCPICILPCPISDYIFTYSTTEIPLKREWIPDEFLNSWDTFLHFIKKIPKSKDKMEGLLTLFGRDPIPDTLTSYLPESKYPIVCSLFDLEKDVFDFDYVEIDLNQKQPQKTIPQRHPLEPKSISKSTSLGTFLKLQNSFSLVAGSKPTSPPLSKHLTKPPTSPHFTALRSSKISIALFKKFTDSTVQTPFGLIVKDKVPVEKKDRVIKSPPEDVEEISDDKVHDEDSDCELISNIIPFDVEKFGRIRWTYKLTQRYKYKISRMLYLLLLELNNTLMHEKEINFQYCEFICSLISGIPYHLSNKTDYKDKQHSFTPKPSFLHDKPLCFGYKSSIYEGEMEFNFESQDSELEDLDFGLKNSFKSKNQFEPALYSGIHEKDDVFTRFKLDFEVKRMHPLTSEQRTLLINLVTARKLSDAVQR